MEVERTLTDGVNLPQTVQLTDYRQRTWPSSDRWRVEARFKRSRGTVNAFGFDVEQWQWSEGVQANGVLGQGELRLDDSVAALAWVDRARAAGGAHRAGIGRQPGGGADRGIDGGRAAAGGAGSY